MKKKQKQKSKKIKKEDSYSRDLRIFSPDGKKLLYILEPGLSIDYQELILGRKKRKSKNSYLKRRSY